MENIIKLTDATLKVSYIIGIGKYTQPATNFTLATPMVQVFVKGLEQPINIAYDTEEERDVEFDKIVQAMIDNASKE